MKLIKPNIIIAGLLVIFMIMNMAFLFHTHTCRSENECHIQDSQCCSSGGELQETSCCGSAQQGEAFSSQHRHSHCYGCCIVNHDDSALLTDQITPNKIKFERSLIIISASLITDCENDQKINISGKYSSHKTPKILFGKDLVIFLNKVKIPSILSV